jgi:hypothetical protein
LFVLSLWGEVTTTICGADRSGVYYTAEIPMLIEPAQLALSLPEMMQALLAPRDKKIEVVNEVDMNKIQKLYSADNYDNAHRLIIDPRRSWREVPKEFFVRRNQGRRVTKENAFEIPKFLDSSRYEIFVFDTKRQIAEQTDRAKKKLKALQKAMVEAQKERPSENGTSIHRRGVGSDNNDIIRYKRLSDYPDKLLRLLDAYSEGVSKTEIGKKLFGQKESAAAITEADNNLNTALHMWEWY